MRYWTMFLRTAWVVSCLVVIAYWVDAGGLEPGGSEDHLRRFLILFGGMLLLSFPLGLVWYFWVVAMVSVIPTLGMLAERWDGFVLAFALSVALCGAIQWFVIVPWLLRRPALTRWSGRLRGRLGKLFEFPG